MNFGKYLLSFTAAGLSVARSTQISEVYMQSGDWGVVKERVMTENLLQIRKQKSALRIYHELALRLGELSDNQLALLVEGTPQEKRHILWIAICKKYAFIQDFAQEVLYEKYLSMSYKFTDFDYEVFFNRKADWHDELLQISATTHTKLRQVVFHMLREAKFLSAENIIIPVLVSQRVLNEFSNELPEIATWFPATISTTLE